MFNLFGVDGLLKRKKAESKTDLPYSTVDLINLVLWRGLIKCTQFLVDCLCY